MISKGLFGRKGLDIEVRENNIGALAEDEVLVQVKACGVCGTDINFVRDWEDEAMPLGHEISAEVMEVGARVEHLKSGDSVIVEDCTMCGVCEDCKTGRSDLCRNMIDMNNQPGMGEYMVLKHNSLDKYEGLDHVSACLTEPLAVSLSSVLHADIPLGGSVVILGNGPLGIMAARVAKLRGAGFVGITGLSDKNALGAARKEAAMKCGCDQYVDIEAESVEDTIMKQFPNGVDRVIVSSPPESIYDALKIIRFGGNIVFFGLHFGGKNVINIDINDLVFRKISLIPTFAEPAINFPLSNKLLREGLVDASVLINKTFTMDQSKEVMQAIVDQTEPIVKAVMVN